MNASPIIFDTRRSPVIYIAYPRPFTAEHWEEMFREMDKLLDAGEPFGWINDARTPYLPTARDRAVLAEHQKRRAADYRRLVKSVATVSTSTVIRGIVTAIEWIHPAPFPHKMLPTVREAEIYVRQGLGLSELALPITADRERLPVAS